MMTGCSSLSARLSGEEEEPTALSSSCAVESTSSVVAGGVVGGDEERVVVVLVVSALLLSSSLAFDKFMFKPDGLARSTSHKTHQISDHDDSRMADVSAQVGQQPKEERLEPATEEEAGTQGETCESLRLAALLLITTQRQCPDDNQISGNSQGTACSEEDRERVGFCCVCTSWKVKNFTSSRERGQSTHRSIG
jgi:hypothetical protein